MEPLLPLGPLLLEEVAQVARRQELPLILGKAQLSLARARLAAGQTSQAKEALGVARSALEAAGETPESAQRLRELGALLVETGASAEAQILVTMATIARQQHGVVPGDQSSQRRRGAV